MKNSIKQSSIYITGGKFRGRRLATPGPGGHPPLPPRTSMHSPALPPRSTEHRRLANKPGSGTHPMGSRERLALFNMLDCRGQTVLDLFAGSGSLGLEAISRGARRAVFVDNSPVARRVIRQNLQALGVEADVLGSIQDAEFTVVFADPPYDQPDFFTTASITEYANLVKSGGTLVLSRPKNAKITPPDSLKLTKTRQYAGLALDFFTKV